MMLFIFILILVALVLGSAWLIYSKISTRSKNSDSAQQIYVGNLDYRLREDELRDFFKKYGNISQVRIIKNRQTGRSKGFAFVTFVSSQYANAALEAHDMPLKGRNIVVRIANPR